MEYCSYYVVPESDLDEKFIDEEISFLLDVSVKNRNKIATKELYAKLVQERYSLWLVKDVSYC